MKKIRFNVDDVVWRLSMAGSIIQQKSPIPILSDFLITTYNKRKQAIVLSSDSEIWLEMKILLAEQEEGDDFSFAVNARDFVAALKSLSGQVVEITLVEDRHVGVGTYDNGRFEFPLDSPDEFPHAVTNTQNEGTCDIIVDSQKVLDAISYTRFAAGVNLITTPYFNGIHFDFSENGMTATATDRNQIALYEDTTVTGGNMHFTVPNKTAQILLSILQKIGGDIKVVSDGNNIIISMSEFRLVSRLCEGNYPDCKKYFSYEQPIQLTVCRQDILKAIKRVLQFCNQTGGQRVELTLDSNSILISSKDVDFSKAAKETVPCSYEGNVFNIMFNGGMMAAAIENFDDENIIMKMSTPRMPIMVTPETQEENRMCACQIMPTV